MGLGLGLARLGTVSEPRVTALVPPAGPLAMIGVARRGAVAHARHDLQGRGVGERDARASADKGGTALLLIRVRARVRVRVKVRGRVRVRARARARARARVRVRVRVRVC